MGRIVIAAYRPKPGRQQALEYLMRHHHERLRAEGLVTDRQPTLMRAKDGTVVEVFEWQSADAIAAAHKNAAVQRMWAEYEEVCDYVPLAQVHEGQDMFAEFEPMTMDQELHPEFSP
jgi:quinol monooxygenase YgiN